MKFMDSVNSNFGIAFGTAASYGAGYVYGAVFRINKIMTARAFAISVATSLTFKVLVDLATGGKELDAKKYYAWRVIGGSLLATVQIAALRQLNVIGSLGTAFLAFNATMLALENLHGYYNKS